MTDAALLTAVAPLLPGLPPFDRSVVILAQWRLTQGKPLTPAQRTHLARLVPAHTPTMKETPDAS